MHLTAGVVFVELEVVSFNAMCENRLVPRQSQLRYTIFANVYLFLEGLWLETSFFHMEI